MVDPVRLEVENEYLKEQNEELKRQLTDAWTEIGKLKAIMGRHNVRGAGRKRGSRNPDKEERLKRFEELMGFGASKEDIMSLMEISLSTYKRYLAEHKRYHTEDSDN